jgi:hypothetical protein
MTIAADHLAFADDQCGGKWWSCIQYLEQIVVKWEWHNNTNNDNKNIDVGKNNNKPPIWEWFIQPIYGDLGVGLLLFYPH